MGDRIKTLLKSKAVWGAVFGAANYLFGVDHIGLHEIANAAGPVISVIGIRDAITKGTVPTP